MSSRFSVACGAVLALSSLTFAPAVCAEDPRVVVVLNSADELIGDLEHICVDLAGKRKAWNNNVLPNIDLFLFGVDRTKPFRYDVIIGGDKARVPASLPGPSALHLELLKEGYDGAVHLDNSQTTPEERTAVFAAFRDKTLAGIQKRPDETQEAFALRKVNREQSLETMERLFVESSLVTIGLTIDSEENVGTGKFVLAARRDTPLAETLKRQAQQPSRFAGVAKPKEPMLAARLNYLLSEMSTRQFAEVYKLMKIPLHQQIDRTEGLTDDQKGARKEIAGLVLDMLTTSLDLGNWDGLAQITSSAGGKHTGLIAVCAKGGASVATILELLPASANGCKTDLNVDTAGDVAIHRLTITEGYPHALREFFGDSGEVFIGAGPDAIWVSVGDRSLDALRAGVAAAAKAPEVDVDPIVASLDADLLPVLQLMNRLRKDGDFDVMATLQRRGVREQPSPAEEDTDDQDRGADKALMLQDDENYRLRIDLKRVEDWLEGEVSFESGILKAIGEVIVSYARENLG